MDVIGFYQCCLSNMSGILNEQVAVYVISVTGTFSTGDCEDYVHFSGIC